MSAFLAMLSAAERRRTLDLAQDVTAASEGWLRDFPVVRRKSVTAACSLAAAVGMPTLGVTELTLLTRWWLWIFGVDDRFDDFGLAEPELMEWTARFEASLRREPRRTDPDLMLAAFGSIRCDLGRYPLFRQLSNAWYRGMADIIRGMLIERHWCGVLAAEDLPSYEVYLENGIKTISVRPYVLAGCAIAGEPAAANEFGRLDAMIYSAARCFRLANDLRSDAREREEGKLNGVSLLQREFMASGSSDSQALARARAKIRDNCAADLIQVSEMRERAAPAITTMARFVWAHTAFVWDMYQTGDYDTVSELLDAGVIM
jgi:Terpene synthase family 2, C-terminal metal binding